MDFESIMAICEAESPENASVRAGGPEGSEKRLQTLWLCAANISC